MTSDSHRPPASKRRAEGESNPQGGVTFRGTLTPSARTDTVELHLPPPPVGRVLYPLRYGVVKTAFDTARYPTLDFSGYRGLDTPYRYGLRPLRPRTYLYLIYFEARRLRTRVWRVLENGQFMPMPEVGRIEKGNMPDDSRLYRGSIAMPFVTVPLPTAERAIAETAYLLTCDTPLNEATLTRLERNETELAETATPFRLKGAETQRGCFAATDLAEAPGIAELAERARSRTQVPEWSESDLVSTYSGAQVNAMLQNVTSAGRMPPALAVALHDPVGLMSEMSHLTGLAIDDLQTYGAEASRKLMVSEWIELLGAQKAREVELDVFNNDPTSGVMAGVGGGHADRLRDRAYAAGVAARAERLSHSRETERQRFVATHPTRLQEKIDRVAARARMSYAVYCAIKPRYHAMLRLYDDSDDRNYLDLRRVVAFTLGVLSYDPQGEQELQSELTAQGPVGLWGRALTGHPEVASYVVWRNTGPNVANNLSAPAMNRLTRLIEQLPADEASRQLGLITQALIARRLFKNPVDVLRSAYGPAFEVLCGEILSWESIQTRQAGKWLRDTYGIRGVNGFRPKTVVGSLNDLIDFAKVEALRLRELRQQQQALLRTVNFWHGIKVSISALGLLVSVQNVMAAISKFGREDGQVLANTLNLGGSLFASGAAAMLGAETIASAQRSAAQVLGNSEAAASHQRRMERFGNIAIGLAAGAAFLTAFKDLLFETPAQSGKSAAITATGGMIQFAAGSVGGLHLLGRLSQDSVDLAMRIMKSMSVSRVGVIRAATAITRLGSGPIGWALLGMEAIYTALRAWHSRVVAEAKVTGWIARSIWGVGNPALRFNPAQELYEFFRLFQTPHVETDVAVVRSLLTTLPVVAGYRMISAGRLDPLPADARTLVVTLPGWQPQISAYRIAQHSGLRALTSAVIYDDPGKVTVRDGVGHVVIETGSLMGTTVVDYWPNGFTDPDSRYTVSN